MIKNSDVLIINHTVLKGTRKTKTHLIVYYFSDTKKREGKNWSCIRGSLLSSLLNVKFSVEVSNILKGQGPGIGPGLDLDQDVIICANCSKLYKSSKSKKL